MRRSTLLLFFLGAFGVFGFFAHGYVENTDGAVAMHAARALWVRGDPGLMREGPDTSAAERYVASTGYNGMTGVNGKHYPWYPIGHQLLLVPAVAIGAQLTAWFPYVEERVANPVLDEFVWARFLASFLPALAAAGSALVLLLLARELGCTPRQALLVTGVVTLCTQFLPGASETLSDPPGTFFLLAMAWVVARARREPSAGGALFAGFAGGWAVLCRYPHAVPVAILSVVLLAQARRQRRLLADLAMLSLGALPELVVFFGANLFRFGSWTETGYSAGATPEWWSFPPYLGIPLILLAPGKGILLFSPPLFLALAQALRRASWSSLFGPALLILLVPLVVAGHTAGWAAGQCWSVRYMTASVALFVAVALALGKPWVRHPGLFAAVCGLGLVVSLGGVLTPYRGHQQLAYVAQPISHPDHVNGADRENAVVFAPRYSPLHGHWIYALLSATGRLAKGGSANTTEPLFGVAVPETAAQPVRVTWPADTSFRHWWMPYMHAFFGWPLWWVMLLWVALTTGALGTAVRRIAAQRHCATDQASSA